MDINYSIDYVYNLPVIKSDTSVEIGDESPRVMYRFDTFMHYPKEFSIIHYGSPGKSICLRNEHVMIYTQLDNDHVTYLNKPKWLETEEEFFQFSLLHNVIELSYDSYKKLRELHTRLM